MLMASCRPPLRAPAALALAIYAFVVMVGPALLHEFACSGHGAPHCLVCASVESVSSTAQPAAFLPGDRSDAGLVVSIGSLRDGVVATAPAVDRAPPVIA
jgi:hypothetical protein